MVDDLKIKSLRRYAIAVYILYIIGSSFTPIILSIVGLIMAYIEKDEAKGTYLESHFRTQIAKFWRLLLFSIVIAVFLLLPATEISGVFWLLAIPALIALAIWWWWFLVKGIIRVIDEKPYDASYQSVELERREEKANKGEAVEVKDESVKELLKELKEIKEAILKKKEEEND